MASKQADAPYKEEEEERKRMMAMMMMMMMIIIIIITIITVVIISCFICSEKSKAMQEKGKKYSLPTSGVDILVLRRHSL
jgi:heme/copper-type cytochrome/quinol oxidase subunit 2